MAKISFSRIDSGISLVDRVIGKIKKAILEETLAPGDRLPPEKTLCKMLGISRGSDKRSTRCIESSQGVGSDSGKRDLR